MNTDKKIMSPFTYFIFVIPVFFFALFSIITTDNVVNSHTLFRNGDVNAFLAILFWGSIFFGGTSYALLSFEGVFYPTIKTHFRHCGVLYPLFILFFIWVVQSKVYESGSLGTAIVFLLGAALFVGIAVNALTLFIVAKKRKKIQA